MIDIGGIALLSAAARNYAGVAAVCEPAPLRAGWSRSCATLGTCLAEMRQRLAAEAFADVAAYDAEVAGYLNHIAGTRFPDAADAWCSRRSATCPTARTRTSEAAFYRETTHRTGSLADATAAAGHPSRPSTTCSTSTRRTASRPTSPRPRAASSSRPTRRAWPPTTRLVERLPTGARGRPGERVRRGRRRQPRGRRGDRRGRSPATPTRRSWRPAYSEAARCDPAARGRR